MSVITLLIAGVGLAGLTFSKKKLKEEIRAIDADPNLKEDVKTAAKKNARENSVAAKQMVAVIVSTAGQIANTFVSYHLGGLSLNNGDSDYKDRADRQNEVVNEFASFIMPVINAGVTGSLIGGLAGAGVGASLALVNSGVTLGAKYASRRREYDYTMFSLDSSMNISQERSGINITNGRTRMR